MSDLDQRVVDLISNHKHFQFSASWCPDCVYSISTWTKFNVLNKIHIFDIGSLPKQEQEDWRQAFQRVTGSRNLPTIFFDGKVWGTEVELHNFENKGTLESELKKIGLL